MSRERIVLIALAVLAIGALLFAGAAAGQRSAWMEGYMMGRLSAGGGAEAAGAGAAAAAAMLPYAPYGVGFAHHGPGFGGVLLVLGAVAFGLFLCRFAHRARWARWQTWMAMQGAQQGAAQAGSQAGPQGWPQADWRHGPPPPWMHGPWGRGPWSQGSWTAQSPASAEQGQPSQQPQQPQQPPAGEPPAER